MKEYLVTYKPGFLLEHIWIVQAKDAKDAIQQVYKEYEEWELQKNELKARSLGSLHNENGKIIEAF